MYLFGKNNILNDVLNNHSINYAWQKKKKFKNLPDLKDQFQYIFVEIKSEKNNPSPPTTSTHQPEAKSVWIFCGDAPQHGSRE